MSIQTFLFYIDMNPYLAALIVIAAVIIYLIKRGYDWSRQQLNAKAQRGQHIY